MAAFSRGCLPSLMRHVVSKRTPSTYSTNARNLHFLNAQSRIHRLFSSSPLLNLASKKKGSKGPIPLKASKAPPVQTQTFAELLTQRTSPTILYQAPSYTAFIIGSYSFSFFCFSYAAWNFHNHYLFPPPGLATWVPIAFGVVCIFMTGFGTWLMLGPSKYDLHWNFLTYWTFPLLTLLNFRIIKSITALPAASRALTSPSSSIAPSLNLQVELLPLFPYLTRPQRFTVPTTALTLANRLYQPASASSDGLPYISRREAVLARDAELKYDREHLMTAPFRHLSQALFRLMTSLRRVWTREGFTRVLVEGRRGVWKLDTGGGWALDEGRGLDRLVKVRNI